MIIRQASQSLVYFPGHDPDRVAGFTISVGWPSTSVMVTQWKLESLFGRSGCYCWKKCGSAGEVVKGSSV
jgi:hypothetical protein